MEIKSRFSLKPEPDSPELRAQQERQLREAADMYEQHFLREMVRNMRNSVPEGGLVQTNFAEKIFREQLDGQYVESWSKRGGVGFADMIFEHVKERYLNPKENAARPAGPLPLDKNYQVHPMPLEAPDTSQFIIEGPAGLETSQRELVMPWPGVVQESFTNESGHSKISVRHDNGLRSQFLLVGRLEENLTGRMLSPGQRLGLLDERQPRIQWRIGRA